MNDNTDDPLARATEWLAANKTVALATVVKTWGSAPRPVGSQMAVREDGVFAGSVSGGCVEGAVLSESAAALKDGKTRNLTFGVSNEDAWAVGLACGGTIEVNVVPVRDAEQREALRAVAAARDHHLSAVLATDVMAGGMRAVALEHTPGDALGEAAQSAARHDQSTAAEIDGQKIFLTVFNPALDLVIVGAVHIAQSLAGMATLAGYAVRIVDPRTSFATPERFPGVTLINEWADEALAKKPLTARSAVVALTHDPKLDDPALIAALKSDCVYIGALGSKQTHARRLERLRAQGFTDNQLARIHGPIGLDIGAKGTAEIAVAVLAEIISALHGT
jgi:xanthine dehydrogenase accessory factor